MNQTISEQDLNEFEKDYNKNLENSLLSLSVQANGIHQSATDESKAKELPFVFNVNIDSGDVTNQRRSGRCWMFSGLNVIRTILFEKFAVKNLELSEAYLQFYDKLEKANFFLEKSLEFASEDICSRNNVFLLDNTIQDGGHFVMFTNLVKKYGVLPYDLMPDLAVSKDTGELNSLLSYHLSQGMRDLRRAKKENASEEEISKIKKAYLDDVYRILCMCLGTPVKEFAFEYVDKDNHTHKLDKMTPKAFFDTYIAKDFNEYIPLCDAPMKRMEKYTKYTCSLVNNVLGSDPIYFFNVDRKELKDALIASLKDKEPVWFASDVSSQSLRKRGILSKGILKTHELFSLKDDMNKEDRLSYRSSFCNHAMTFTGVNLLEDGTPNRYKVENSWGKDNGKDGYFVMDDAWFNEYVYQIFVNKKYVSEKVNKAYEEAKVVKEDPFDTLWRMN